MQDFENMPMREPMRERSVGKHYMDPQYLDHGFEKRHNQFTNIIRKLNRSIGEDYDRVYSWFCNKYKNEPDFGYLKSYFLSCFTDFYPRDPEYAKIVCEFKLDDEKKIQKNPDAKTWNHDDSTRKIIQNIHWEYFKTVYSHKDGEWRAIPISEKEYNKLKIPEDSTVSKVKKIAYNIKVVSKNSREWKRYNGSGQKERDKMELLKNGVKFWQI